MIRFTIDGPDAIRGYVLIAAVDTRRGERSIYSGPLPDSRAIALQARELADVAAALLESLPEHERAFEFLHDAIDVLPTA